MPLIAAMGQSVVTFSTIILSPVKAFSMTNVPHSSNEEMNETNEQTKTKRTNEISGNRRERREDTGFKLVATKVLHYARPL